MPKDINGFFFQNGKLQKECPNLVENICIETPNPTNQNLICPKTRTSPMLRLDIKIGWREEQIFLKLNIHYLVFTFP